MNFRPLIQLALSVAFKYNIIFIWFIFVQTHKSDTSVLRKKCVLFVSQCWQTVIRKNVLNIHIFYSKQFHHLFASRIKEWGLLTDQKESWNVMLRLSLRQCVTGKELMADCLKLEINISCSTVRMTDTKLVVIDSFIINFVIKTVAVKSGGKHGLRNYIVYCNIVIWKDTLEIPISHVCRYWTMTYDTLYLLCS